MCVCVCVCACVRACVHACMRACMRACVYLYVCVNDKDVYIERPVGGEKERKTSRERKININLPKPTRCSLPQVRVTPQNNPVTPVTLSNHRRVHPPWPVSANSNIGLSELMMLCPATV